MRLKDRVIVTGGAGAGRAGGVRILGTGLWGGSRKASAQGQSVLTTALRAVILGTLNSIHTED